MVDVKTLDPNWSEEDNSYRSALGTAVMLVWDEITPELQKRIVQEATKKGRSLLLKSSLEEHFRQYIDKNKNSDS